MLTNPIIKLNINEIFYSIQGESSRTGLPTIFIRLTGCPLRCKYCDTEYGFKGNNMLSIEEILQQISPYKTPYVCITGGEPLAQKNCLNLLDVLVGQNYQVSLETSGSIDISKVNQKVMIVMDIKTPSSGESDKNLFSNIKYLKEKDEVKFVIGNHEDFDWSAHKIKQYHFNSEVLFSPVMDVQNETQLAEWILEKQLKVRLQIQLHKQLWGDVAGK